MTNETLKGLKVAILVTDGFEQVELERPRKALDKAGAQTQIVSPKAERVRAWKFREWGDQLRVDVPLNQAKPQDFDALLLPGGLVNLDALRVQPKAMAFAKASSTPASQLRRSAVAHGPSLRSTRLGRLMTSCSSLKTDLENAGASWVDQEVVVDRNLVTGRSPTDIPTFNREMIKVFSAASERQHAP